MVASGSGSERKEPTIDTVNFKKRTESNTLSSVDVKSPLYPIPVFSGCRVSRLTQRYLWLKQDVLKSVIPADSCGHVLSPLKRRPRSPHMETCS